jgi:hypothetical protein
LPGEERPVVAFGQALPGFPTGVRLVVEKTDWQRVSAHDVGDMLTYLGARLNFPTENFTFVRAQGGADNIPAHQISFDIKNDSAYSYWQSVFYVDLLDGGARTGIIYIELKEFRAGETRHIEIGSLAGDFNVTDIRVHPVINVFAGAVYMAPGTE